MNNISEQLGSVYTLLQRISVMGKDSIRNLDSAMQILEQIYPVLVDMENELTKKEAKDDV